MGVKYIMQLKSPDDVAWQCNIETPGYNAPPVAIRGVSEQGMQLDYDNDKGTDDPFDVFKKSTLTLNFYNQAQVDMEELQGAADKDFTAKIFRNGALFWVGYLQPENLQWPFLSPPIVVNLSFVCGLALLDDIPYTHTDLMGTTGSLSRCPMNYIRNILFQSANLGLTLPIRWTNQLVCTAFSDEVFTGSVQWSPANEGFYTYQQGATGDNQGPLKTCGYILRGFLQAMQCRIFQIGGKWIIRRINDTVSSTLIPYKEIAGNLGMMVVQSGNQNLNKQIGRSGYRFVNENPVLTTVQGIKSFKTTYAANIRTNIIPNGNYDIIKTALTVPEILSGGILIYWGSYGELVTDNGPSLDGRSGYSAEVTNVSGDDYFTMVVDGGEEGKNGLPIDAFTLIAIINFSFTFSGGLGFAPVDGDGFIIWDTKPLQFKMILNYGSTQYFLNEFGTWSTVEAWIPIVIAGLKLDDIAQVAFDKFQGVKIPQPPAQPGGGDVCDLQIVFDVKSGQTYSLDNVQVTVDNGNDVYEVFNDTSKNTSTDETSLDISSSFGGYMLSNFMSSPFKSGLECAYNDGLIYSGTLTGINSHAVMRFRYKASQVLNTDMYVAGANWSFDEIYAVDALLGKKFLPLNAKYNIEKGIVSMVAMEARNDNITLRESFYSSNDQQLSN